MYCFKIKKSRIKKQAFQPVPYPACRFENDLPSVQLPFIINVVSLLSRSNFLKRHQNIFDCFFVAVIRIAYSHYCICVVGIFAFHKYYDAF